MSVATTPLSKPFPNIPGIIFSEGGVATHGIHEYLILSYQTFVTFPSLSYLSYLLNLCSLYHFLSPYQSFVVLSNVCHLLAPCYLFTFYVIISPYKCTCCTYHKNNNSFSCLIVRTLSAPIYLSNSPGVFAHRAILIWRD